MKPDRIKTVLDPITVLFEQKCSFMSWKNQDDLCYASNSINSSRLFFATGIFILFSITRYPPSPRINSLTRLRLIKKELCGLKKL